MRGPVATLVATLGVLGCGPTSPAEAPQETRVVPEADFTLGAEDTHARFSAAIAPALTVPSGSVVEAFTKEATDGQLNVNSTAADVANVDFDPIHPLTGPVFVEGAEPGDVLKVTLHDIEILEWGWTGVFPGFGFLADEFTEPYLKTFRFEPGARFADFAPGIRIPLAPFPGVVGVAPASSTTL